MTDSAGTHDLKALIQEKYGALARQAGAPGGCCGTSAGCGCAQPEPGDPVSADLYTDDERDGLPKEAVTASLGCGNPTALADLRPGETVLDLGSGGGIDVLLSARRVGPSGRVFGLDMTDDMLALARKNQHQAGVENVEFLKGDIEQIPLPDRSVDVIVSNCVINLATDKDRVLAEAFRVLKPGGRFAVSDIVVQGRLSPAVRQDVEAWAGCVAGALEESDYRAKLAAAGFEAIAVEPWRTYNTADVSSGCCGSGRADGDGAVVSAFIRATRPAL
jgi:SAM-dependent methyltransferase